MAAITYAAPPAPATFCLSAYLLPNLSRSPPLHPPIPPTAPHQVSEQPTIHAHPAPSSPARPSTRQLTHTRASTVLYSTPHHSSSHPSSLSNHHRPIPVLTHMVMPQYFCRPAARPASSQTHIHIRIHAHIQTRPASDAFPRQTSTQPLRTPFSAATYSTLYLYKPRLATPRSIRRRTRVTWLIALTSTLLYADRLNSLFALTLLRISIHTQPVSQSVS